MKNCPSPHPPQERKCQRDVIGDSFSSVVFGILRTGTGGEREEEERCEIRWSQVEAGKH